MHWLTGIYGGEIGIIKSRYEDVLKPLLDLNELDWRLVRALDQFDRGTLEHSIRTLLLAQELILAYHELPNGRFIRFVELMEDSGISFEKFCRAALLHDIGKLVISKEILFKPGEYSFFESQVVQYHEEATGYILRHFGYELEAKIAEMHHNYGKRKDKINFFVPEIGMEIAVCDLLHLADVEDAITTHRVYRSKLTELEALRIIVDHAREGKVGRTITYLWLNAELEKINLSRLDWLKDSLWCSICKSISHFLRIESMRLNKICLAGDQEAQLSY